MTEIRHYQPCFLKNHYTQRLKIINLGMISVLFLISLSQIIPLSQSKPQYIDNAPHNAEVILNNSMESNQTLKYVTYIQYTTNDPAEDAGNFKINTNQNITAIIGDPLWIEESTDINTSLYKYDPVNEKSYTYNINTTSNQIWNESSEFSSFFKGGWQHNYPLESEKVSLNSNEISLVFNKLRVINLTYQEDVILKYGNTSIETSKFTGTLSFDVTCGSG